jgi:hypothetical protein
MSPRAVLDDNPTDCVACVVLLVVTVDDMCKVLLNRYRRGRWGWDDGVFVGVRWRRGLLLCGEDVGY